jgi:hypothetical protein
MLMSQYAGSRFVDLDDVNDGGPFQQTIAEVSIGNYGKPVIKFSNGRQLSVNVTNCGTLIEAFGEDSKDWIGETIEVYAGETKFKGEPTPSVLVRAIQRAPGEKKKPPKPKKLSTDMDDEIAF